MARPEYSATVEPWSLSGIDDRDRHDKADNEFLQDNADAMELVPCTIELHRRHHLPGQRHRRRRPRLQHGEGHHGLHAHGEGKLTPQ
jgi:hypothetical protein